MLVHHRDYLSFVGVCLHISLFASFCSFPFQFKIVISVFLALKLELLRYVFVVYVFLQFCLPVLVCFAPYVFMSLCLCFVMSLCFDSLLLSFFFCM